MKRPTKAETEALATIGTKPIASPRRYPWESTTILTNVRDRVGQSFIYHTFDFITESWGHLQDDLNDRQRDLEAVYGPFVELVNVYRKNSTKNDGQAVVVIFKILIAAVPF